MSNWLQSIFGSRQDRWLKSARLIVEKINAMEADLQGLTDAQLQSKTDQMREHIQTGATTDAILPQAYALVREAARRTLGLRAFDVQLLGAIALQQGKVAEMRTGEGKTLVATFPAYLNALQGRGVHVITVNDYLARRDSETMGKVFQFLGLTTGVIQHGQDRQARKKEYACDITYGTNNEFGFDYLRDNLATDPSDMAHRGLSFAIIDEIDSILIDEARTPLVISAPQDTPPELYSSVDVLAQRMVRQETEEGPGDFYLDPKTRAVSLSEDGLARADELLGQAGLLTDDAYGAQHLNLLAHLNAALRARHGFMRDKDYMIQDGQVVIVDEFTGRALAGRRWGEGLHQAIEAKEGLEIHPEDQVLASITLQNFFRSYDRICGMTGTADTEAAEFQQIYGLEVMVIPTHRPMIRIDREDQVFLTRSGKFKAVINEIKDCAKRRQPVLVGTTSIEVSEDLSRQLHAHGIVHEVLNAKHHEREAQIIADAGRPGAVTIATNMAGRGTDIVLGGHPPGPGASPEDSLAWQDRHAEAIAAGGLHVVGTERHESRRIDNQLRGRSGRQGDPGSSRFFLSAEDHVLKAFMPEWSRAALARMGMQEDQPIEARLISRQVEAAQRRIEGFYFDQRKSLIDYDDVANRQRQAIYAHRHEIMSAIDPSDQFMDLVEQWSQQEAVAHLADFPVSPEDHLDRLMEHARKLGLDLSVQPLVAACQDNDARALAHAIRQQVLKAAESRKEQWGAEKLEVVERAALLAAIDGAWQEHMTALDILRNGIHLRAMAQKQPKQEYKREAFLMFQELSESLAERTLALVLRYQPPVAQQVDPL